MMNSLASIRLLKQWFSFITLNCMLVNHHRSLFKTLSLPLYNCLLYGHLFYLHISISADDDAISVDSIRYIRIETMCSDVLLCSDY